jgi:hypothetical protein
LAISLSTYLPRQLRAHIRPSPLALDCTGSLGVDTSTLDGSTFCPAKPANDGVGTAMAQTAFGDSGVELRKDTVVGMCFRRAVAPRSARVVAVHTCSWRLSTSAVFCWSVRITSDLTMFTCCEPSPRRVAASVRYKLAGETLHSSPVPARVVPSLSTGLAGVSQQRTHTTSHTTSRPTLLSWLISTGGKSPHGASEPREAVGRAYAPRSS